MARGERRRVGRSPNLTPSNPAFYRGSGCAWLLPRVMRTRTPGVPADDALHSLQPGLLGWPALLPPVRRAAAAARRGSRGARGSRRVGRPHPTLSIDAAAPGLHALVFPALRDPRPGGSGSRPGDRLAPALGAAGAARQREAVGRAGSAARGHDPSGGVSRRSVRTGPRGIPGVGGNARARARAGARRGAGPIDAAEESGRAGPGATPRAKARGRIGAGQSDGRSRRSGADDTS